MKTKKRKLCNICFNYVLRRKFFGIANLFKSVTNFGYLILSFNNLMKTCSAVVKKFCPLFNRKKRKIKNRRIKNNYIDRLWI